MKTFITALFSSTLLHAFVISIPTKQKQNLSLKRPLPYSVQIQLREDTSLKIKPSSKKIKTKKFHKKLAKKAAASEIRETVLSPVNGTIRPHYPLRSRRMGHQGTVTIKVWINKEGMIVNSLIVQSSGYLELDQEARRAIGKARFTPLLKNGVAMMHEQNFTFKFELN